MEKLALSLPGLTGTIAPIVKTGTNETIKTNDLRGIISASLDIVFLIASVLMFVWMVWGIFEYLFAGGDKEKLGKARSRITWAIVGFIIIIISFTIQRYVQEIFPPNSATPLTPVSMLIQ